jgi:hypothetical protein
MDLFTISIGLSLLSAVVMFTAIIYIITYVIGSFSSRSGVMSLKFVLFSLLYFFGSTILLIMGSEWLAELARVPHDGLPYFLNVGAGCLALAALLHICCGSLTALMYLRGKYSVRVKR